MLPAHDEATQEIGFSAVEFRRCLGEFITGVTVITTVSRDGAHYGLTANSFSSVSLDPPLILWSLRRNAACFPVFEDADTFAVNILAEDQVEQSRRFSRPLADRFDGVGVSYGSGGLPLLDGAVAHLECRREAAYPGGDHVVFVGRVLRIRHHGRKPLAFRSGQYMVVHPHEPSTVEGLDQDNVATLAAMYAARPLIEEVGRETDRTVGIAVWGNLGPTMVWWRESSRPLQTRVRFGLVVSLLDSSTGALFAAFAPDEVIAPLLQDELARHAAAGRTRFTTREDLQDYLREVRAHGLGSIIGVITPGVNERAHSAFSAPVFDASGAIVLALAMIGDADEFHPDDPAIDKLRDAAHALSARLGYRGKLGRYDEGSP